MTINDIKTDEKIKKHSRKEIILRLLSYLKPFKRKTMLVMFFLIFVMFCNVINPHLLQKAIDVYIENKDMKGLLILGLIMIGINFVAMLISKLRIVMMSSITNKILINIREELYTHIQKLSFSFFDNRPVGKILSRVIGDVNSLNNFFNSAITNLIPEILTLVTVTIIMFATNFKLSLITICLLPILALIIFSIETIAEKKWQSYRQKRSNFNGSTHESFSGVRVIQAYAAEEKNKKDVFSLIDNLVDGFLDAIKITDFFWPIVDLSSGIGMLLIYSVSLKLFNNSEITLGTIMSFTLYVGMFWRPIINISSFYNTLVTNFAAAERIFDILDLKPDIENSSNAKLMPPIKGTVEFKNVFFQYDENSKVLDNVSFKVKPGESIALVGATGAGKTTIVNLISRFYDCTNGQILIDSTNVKDVDLHSLRSQMGIMLQDTFLFSTTIKENVRYGKLDATDEEIIAACKAVNAHDFIMSLPNGYDTDINERGSRLSVGQRQLVSFARALLSNPKILILDEATSNIDTKTEKLVQDSINKVLKNRTSFVIAHRLSTIRDCDRIMVIDDGKIIEAGSHDELIKTKGQYYKLYMSQCSFLSEGA